MYNKKSLAIINLSFDNQYGLNNSGSGGGWNQSLSANCQFEENMALIKMDESFNNSQLLVATGCSLNHSWMGGFSCHQSLFPDLSLPDYKWVGAGGFGGGGGSCKGGGGGGGFIGKFKMYLS